MKRILVVTSGALFVRGGHMVIAEETCRALRHAGFTADLLVTPQNRFGRQGSAYLATWLTDVGQTAGGEAIDQVISFRYPSYAVRHPRHVCWLNHRMREYYDLWERFAAGISWRARLKERARRRAIRLADRVLLTRNVTRLLAQSRTIQQRLLRFGGIPSDLLYPPAPDRPYRTDDYGDYIFAVSRLHPLKRLDLLIDAVAAMRRSSLSVKIAGDGEDRARLEALIARRGLAGRVELLGAIPDAALVDHYARCRAVFFAPWNEDYGFVTLEAFRSGKAVVTAHDSGGPAELVAHGHTGFVVEPAAEDVAACLDRLAADRGLAERLGQAALPVAAGHSWDRAVAALVEGPAS